MLCAVEIQRALAGHEWPAGAAVRVRIGIHTGQAVPVGGDYTGLAVHRGADLRGGPRRAGAGLGGDADDHPG